MSKDFFKVTIIAIIVVSIIVIYYFIIPKIDYSAIFADSDNYHIDGVDTIFVRSQSLTDSLPHPVQARPKKKYVKKIKPVSFSEITGGDNFDALDPFFAKLDLLDKKEIKQLRIAYFGDSLTESDLVTSQLRKVWQDSLGGQGVGFVPAVSDLSQFRASIGHSYSNNWTEYSLSNTDDRDKPLGLFGNVTCPAIVQKSMSDTINYSWHKYQMREGKWLARPTLILLNDKSPLTIDYVIADDTLSQEIEVSPLIQFITLTDSLVKNLSISYFPQDTCYVYGVDFSERQGIYIDNYSIRGNKGNNFIHLQEDIISQLYTHFAYDLTILHYGANVTDPIMKDYSWYRISMKKNIAYLQSFPFTDAMILFSVSDRGALLDSTWVSSPDLPYLIKEQKRIAKDSKIGFYNIFTALGGENSNNKLFDERLLTSDRTHFTRPGAKFLANTIFNQFQRQFVNWQELKHD